MTSASNEHGGQEVTSRAFYITLAHWGAILVPPGYTDPAVFAAGGNPYGTSVTATDGELSEAEIAAAQHQARRAVQVAAWLGEGQKALEREAQEAAAASAPQERAYLGPEAPRA